MIKMPVVLLVLWAFLCLECPSISGEGFTLFGFRGGEVTTQDCWTPEFLNVFND